MKKLSTREKDVLDLLAEGYKNSKIATTLGINEKTISTYISRLKSKIGLDKHPSDECNVYKIVEQSKKLGLLDE